MSIGQADFLAGAAACLLYILYVLRRVLSSQRAGWGVKLLISVPVLLFPLAGAAFVHLAICSIAPRPRDDRFLAVLGIGGACGALLAYALSFYIPVHDSFAFCFILLGFAGFNVFVPFTLRMAVALRRDWRGGLSMLPKWTIVLAGVAIASAALHLALYDIFAERGVPRERLGRYYLEIDDRPIREISEGQYHAYSGHLGRAASASLFAFFLVPGFFFLRRPGQLPGLLDIGAFSADSPSNHKEPQ